MKIITPEEALVLHQLGVPLWWMAPGREEWWDLYSKYPVEHLQKDMHYPKAWGIEDGV